MAHPAPKLPPDTPEWGRVLSERMDDRFEALLREAAKDREQADKDREQADKDREQIATTLQVLVVLNNQIHRGQKRQSTLLERSLRLLQTMTRLQVETIRLLRSIASGRNGRGHRGNGNGRGRV